MSAATRRRVSPQVRASSTARRSSARGAPGHRPGGRARPSTVRRRAIAGGVALAPLVLGGPDRRRDLGQQPAEPVRRGRSRRGRRQDAGGLQAEQRWQPEGPGAVPRLVEARDRLVGPAATASTAPSTVARHDVARPRSGRSPGDGRPWRPRAPPRCRRATMPSSTARIVAAAPRRRAPALEGGAVVVDQRSAASSQGPIRANWPLRPAAQASVTHSRGSREHRRRRQPRPSCRYVGQRAALEEDGHLRAQQIGRAVLVARGDAVRDGLGDVAAREEPVGGPGEHAGLRSAGSVASSSRRRTSRNSRWHRYHSRRGSSGDDEQVGAVQRVEDRGRSGAPSTASHSGPDSRSSTDVRTSRSRWSAASRSRTSVGGSPGRAGRRRGSSRPPRPAAAPRTVSAASCSPAAQPSVRSRRAAARPRRRPACPRRRAAARPPRRR